MHALARHEDQGPRIGPNAVIQTRAVLLALGHDRLAQVVFARAGLSAYIEAPPANMVPQSEVSALFGALSDSCTQAEAARLAREAGRRTGDYILAHRIPTSAQRLLRRLPRGLAARLLLSAIKKHAWTFAGNGGVSCRYGPRLSISIADNPIAMPGCPWHVAVFERLFGELVDAGVSVRHERCCARRDEVCHFDIVLS